MIERVEMLLAPPVELSTGVLGEVQEADREIARWTAVRARAVARFAAARPATADRQQGEPGAMRPERWAARAEVLRPVSEWAVPELVIALSRSGTDVQRLLERSLLLRRVPGVLAAVEAGALNDAHLWAFLDLLAPVDDAALRAEVEGAVLGWLAARAAGHRITTPPQLRDKLRRELQRRGAREAAQRELQALRERGVFRQEERGEGMGAVAAVLTEPEVQALLLALEAYADAVDDEPGAPPRTRAQKMADCLLDLVLRPGESGHPPVQVVLTLVASVSTVLGGDEPAELGGRTVSAETARQLLHALTGAAVVPEPPEGESAAVPAAEEVLLQLADWWDDVEQRVLTGELDPGPQPLPGQIAAALAGELGAELCPDSPPEGADEELAALEALLLPGEHLDVEDLPVPPPDDASPGPPTAAAGPWAEAGPWGRPPWAEADRAVQDAGTAVREATLALGRARGAVRTAARSDADDEQSWRSSAAGRVDAAADALERAAGGHRRGPAGARRPADPDPQRRPRRPAPDRAGRRPLGCARLADRPPRAAPHRPLRAVPVPAGPARLRPRPLRPAGPRGAAAHRRLPPLGGARPLRAGPRPALPVPRLPAAGRDGGDRPPGALPRRPHRGREPGRPVHRRPPGQAPGARVLHRAPPRRVARRRHTDRPARRHGPAAVLISPPAARPATG